MLLSTATFFFFFPCSCPEQVDGLIAALVSVFEADVSMVTQGEGAAWLEDIATS